MTLEESILALTAQTPSGGLCKIGDDSFRVWYCSDIWEWEYLGESYFDAQDLAAAILQNRQTAQEQATTFLLRALSKGGPSWAERHGRAAHVEPARMEGKALPR